MSMINAAYSVIAFGIRAHERCHCYCSEMVFLHVTCSYSFDCCPPSILPFLYCPPVYPLLFLSANFSMIGEAFPYMVH